MNDLTERSHDTINNLNDEQIAFIQAYLLPSRMEITVASPHDTPYVETDSVSWEFIRLGSKHVCSFNSPDANLNKLLKAIVIKYAQGHMAPLSSERFTSLRRLFENSISISFSSFFDQLKTLAQTTKASDYYLLKAVTRYLFRMGFPGFHVDRESELEFLPTPNVSDPFLRYQDTENTMPSHLKSLIVQRLVEFSTEEGLKSLNDTELKNLSVLGLAYAVGFRPQQFSMATGSTVKLLAINHKTALNRYEVAVPLAKQQKVPIAAPRVALSYEVGVIIDEYKKRFGIEDNDPLFPFNEKIRNPAKNKLSKQLHRALNDALLFIQSDESKKHIAANRRDRPIYSLYDFRHNIGHSMAMMNASAEEIASVLGHTSIVAAQNYIMATPELALLKYKALGQNPIWQDMIGLLLTGYIIDEQQWEGKTISGLIKGQFIYRIGGCSRRQENCHLTKIRSCYGCFYFRPFNCLDKHKKVLDLLTHELIEQVAISQDTGNNNSPLIDTATSTKHEIEMVINRIKGGLI